MTTEQAFDKMMYGINEELDELREELKDYLNGDCTKEHLLAYANLKECDICGYFDLDDYMHENEDGVYCDTCWEAK